MISDSQARLRNFESLTAAGKRSSKINLESQTQTFGTTSTQNRSMNSSQLRAKKGSKLMRQISSGAQPRALRVIDPMNTYCNENILTMPDHAGIKRASAVSPQPTQTQYLLKSPNMDKIGFSPINQEYSTSSSKNGILIVKKSRHTKNQNNSQPAIKQNRNRNSIAQKENLNQQHFTSAHLPQAHMTSKASSGYEGMSATSPSYTTSGTALPIAAGHQAPLTSANSRTKHQRNGSFGFQSSFHTQNKQEEPYHYTKEPGTELLKQQILELQNVIVSMSVIQQRQTMSQFSTQSPVARFNGARSLSPDYEKSLKTRSQNLSTNTRPKTSHQTQASINSRATSKSTKSMDKGTFARAKRMVDQQAQTSQTSSVDRLRFFQQQTTAQKSLKSLNSRNEDIEECCNLKIETISVNNLGNRKNKIKTPKIFKSVKKSKRSISNTKSRSNNKRMFSPTPSKTPEKQTTVKKKAKKISRSRSRSKSAMSPTSQTTVQLRIHKEKAAQPQKIKRKLRQKRTTSANSEHNYMLQTIQSQNNNTNTIQPTCQKVCNLSRVIERSVNTSELTGGTHKSSISPQLMLTKVQLKNNRAQSTLIKPQNRKKLIIQRSTSKTSNPISAFSNTLSPNSQNKGKQFQRPTTSLSQTKKKSKQSTLKKVRKTPTPPVFIQPRTKSAPRLTKLKQRVILSEATPQRASKYNSKSNSRVNSRSKSPLQQTSSFDLRGTKSKKKKKRSKVNSIVAEIARQIQKNYQNQQEYLLHDGTPMNAENLLNITMGGIPAIQQISTGEAPPPRSASRLSNKSKAISAKSYKSKRSNPQSIMTAQQMINQIDHDQTPITEQFYNAAEPGKQYYEDFQEEEDFYDEQTSPSVQRVYKGSENERPEVDESSSPSQPAVLHKGEDSPVFCDEDETEENVHAMLDYSSGQQQFKHHYQSQQSDEKTMSPFRQSPPKMQAFLAQTSSQKVMKTAGQIITFGSAANLSPSRNSSHIVSPSALKRLHAATCCTNCGVPKLALEQVFKQQRLDRITDKSQTEGAFTLHTVNNQEGQPQNIICQQNEEPQIYNSSGSAIDEENTSSLILTENETSQTNSVNRARGVVLERRNRRTRSKKSDSMAVLPAQQENETPIFVRTMVQSNATPLDSGERHGHTLQSMQTNSPPKIGQHHILMEDKRMRTSIEAPNSSAMNTINSNNNFGTIASQITEAALQMSTIQHIGTGEGHNFAGTDDYPEQEEYSGPMPHGQPHKLMLIPQRLTSPNIIQYPKVSYKDIKSKVAERCPSKVSIRNVSPSFIQHYNYQKPQGKFQVPSHIVSKKSRNRRESTINKSYTTTSAPSGVQRNRFYPVPQLAPPSLYTDIALPPRPSVSPSPTAQERLPRAQQYTISQKAKLVIEPKKKMKKSDLGLIRPASTKNSQKSKLGGNYAPKFKLAAAQHALQQIMVTSASERRSFATPKDQSQQLKKRFFSNSSLVNSGSAGHGAQVQKEVYMFKSQTSNDESLKAQAQAYVDKFDELHHNSLNEADKKRLTEHFLQSDDTNKKNTLYEPVLTSTKKSNSKKQQQKFKQNSSNMSGNQQGKFKRSSSPFDRSSSRMKTQEEIDLKIKESQAEIEKLRVLRDQLLKMGSTERDSSENRSPIGIFSEEINPMQDKFEQTQVIDKTRSGSGAFNYILDEQVMSGVISSGQTSKLEHNSDFKDLEECKDLFRQSQTDTQQMLSKQPSLHHVDSATTSEPFDRKVGTGGTPGLEEGEDDLERAISDAVFVHEFANQDNKQ